MGKERAKFEPKIGVATCGVLADEEGMRLIPILLAVLALPALAACNQVYSRTPLVPEAHEGGDPEFRPGLWKIGDDSDGPFNCPFDIRKRLHDWPDCAVAAEFRRGQMFLLDAHHRYSAPRPSAWSMASRSWCRAIG